MAINLTTRTFSCTSGMTVTFTGEGDAFTLTINYDTSYDYKVKVYPKINGTIRYDIQLDEFNTITNGVRGVNKKYSKNSLITKCYTYIGDIDNTFNLVLVCFQNNQNVVDILTTTPTYKLDNSNFTVSTGPTLTEQQTVGGEDWWKEDVSTPDRFLFPNLGRTYNLRFRLQCTLSHPLDNDSNNKYISRIRFTNGYPSLDSTRNTYFLSNNSIDEYLNMINPKSLIGLDNTTLMGNIYKVESIFTELIGSKDRKRIPSTSDTTYNSIIGSLSMIYAWQHMYDFYGTKVYWSKTSDIRTWETDETSVLTFDIKASKDPVFTQPYSIVPWPKIMYKIKVFSKEPDFTIIGDTFNKPLTSTSIGYSTYEERYQDNLEKLYTSDDNRLAEVSNINYQSSIDETQPISLGLNQDAKRLYIYIITVDQLGFYQGLYLNKAIDTYGKVVYSPYRGH